MTKGLQRFPRLNDLYENSQKCRDNNFFRAWLDEEGQNELEFLSSLESDLSQIEEIAWQAFLQKCLPHIYNFHRKVLWVNLWNILNEVKGYIFLKNKGFDRLEFLPEGKYRTPDIRGFSKHGTVLLEVKNVNRSDYDTFWTLFPEPKIACSSSEIHSLVDKLEQLYAAASKQMLEYCSHCGEANEKICFFVIDADIRNYSKNRSEIEKYISGMQTRYSIGIEYVFINRLLKP